MALTFTNNVNKAVRSWKGPDGLMISHIEMTNSATGDYSSGYDLATNAAKMGFRKIVNVLGPTTRTSGGTIRAQVGIYDQNTGKLRFYKTGSATSGVLLEIVAATDNAANDVTSFTVIGV